MHRELVAAWLEPRAWARSTPAIIRGACAAEANQGSRRGNLLDSHAVHRTVHHLGQSSSYYW